MKRILIIGASGGIGVKAISAALEKGYSVRAFSRRASQIPIEDERLEKRDGDALSKSDIDNALLECDAVIQTLGVPFNLRMITGPVSLFSRATEVLLPSMANAGVKRLIAVTGFGAGDSRKQIPFWQAPGFELVFGRAYADKSIQEELIRTSNLDWTIVRPVVLTNGPRTDCYRALTEPRLFGNGLISRADVAGFLIDQVDDDRYIGQAPVLRW